jgi:glycosyltransferase involved in cell wall biosynthesis
LRGYARIAPWLSLARGSDHIHAHFATEATDIARLLSAGSGTPFSFTAHAGDAYASQEQLSVNLREASFARASAQHVLLQLQAANPDATQRIIEVPVAINDERFSHSGSYNAGGPIVAVGRLVEKKGFDDLVTAAAAASAALGRRRVLIAGDGPERQKLQGMIDRHDAPVRLLGAVPNSELPDLLAEAAIFVAPSKIASDGDRDGRPAAIAEAMAAGLPILSTTLPGIPGLVDSGQGVLVPPGDAPALASALAGLLARPAAERAAMGRSAAAQAAALHGRRPVAKKMIDLFTGRAWKQPRQPAGHR